MGHQWVKESSLGNFTAFTGAGLRNVLQEPEQKPFSAVLLIAAEEFLKTSLLQAAALSLVMRRCSLCISAV